MNQYTHTMNFTTNDLNDGLRVLVVRPRTKIAVYEEKIDGEPVAKSKSDFTGKRQVLHFPNMKVGKKYIVQYSFSALPNNEQFEDQPCSDFYMQIKTFNSKKDSGCLSDTL